MSTGLLLSSTPLSMTSREIAELVESRHDNVKVTIERLAERGVIVLPAMQDVPFVDGSGRNRTTSAYTFLGETGKRDSIVVVAQLSPEFTGRLVDRWQELEAKVSLPTRTVLEPQERAVRIFKADLEIAELLNVPLHIAQHEAVKDVARCTGLDYSPLLLSAQAQNSVPDEDVMLEPADLAKALGIRDGAALNKWLEANRLQEKTSEGWVPTELGKPHCVRHYWKTTFKSGYNWKWSKKFVKSLLPENCPGLVAEA